LSRQFTLNILWKVKNSFARMSWITYKETVMLNVLNYHAKWIQLSLNAYQLAPAVVIFNILSMLMWLKTNNDEKWCVG
jgi:hypothetical protein